MRLPEPFGGMIVLIAIVVCLLIGVCKVIGDRKSNKSGLFGIVIIAAPWVLFGLLKMISPGIDEWNPTVEYESEAWGVWEGDGYEVELKSDSTFTAVLKSESISGTWKRDDWNIFLTTTRGEERYMRLVEDGGELLLPPNPKRGEYSNSGPITKKRK